ncbi:DUF1569 domain-containing protein [Alteromonas facilis]|uniref:DUF1569 domain-containing protein n=1 Tax=Alteromonas facilis TaxID=2048004 RepID=UPI000F5CC58C|nr:DUF1569 domain-containing protein [Alteromonas facilis]
MRRRTFLRLSAGACVTAPLVGCGSSAASERLTLDSMLAYLTALKGRGTLNFDGPWPAFATFTHLAQSVEYAMSGFPQYRSDSFQRWVGQPAFWLFKQAGAMHHDTAEAIPGAPALDIQQHDPIAINQSIDRLMSALTVLNITSQTQPHFAYGSLSHDDYMLAQLMHINDHLTLLS